MTTLEDELRAALHTQAHALRIPQQPALDTERTAPSHATGPRWLLVAASFGLIIAGIAALAQQRPDDSEPAPPIASIVPDISTPAATVTTVVPDITTIAPTLTTVLPDVREPDTGAFDAAIEASELLTSPSADDVAQAIDADIYRAARAEFQISPAGNYVALRRCKDSASATCGTGWAYSAGVVGGELRGGLLGEASPMNLRLYLLHDPYFVVMEDAPGTQAPSRAWLIDAVSGQTGVLSWRDEPTTLSSPEQELLLCEESYNSFASECAVTGVWEDIARVEVVGEVSSGGTTVTQTSLVEGRYTYEPTQVGLPKVVDARDGTIRPLAMPNNVAAGLPVAQDGTGRIWIGTDPDGDRLGLAYSDDGGATWTQASLPERLLATDEELVRQVHDDVLEIAADGDRVAVADSWIGDDNTVFVSDDAGKTWTTATSSPGGNGVHLYVLADGRLVVMGSMDTYPSDLLASTASGWAELENVDINALELGSFSDDRFSINGAGVAMIPSFMIPCDGAYPCPGYTEDEISAGGSVLDSIAFSINLQNWSRLLIPQP